VEMQPMQDVGRLQDDGKKIGYHGIVDSRT
jgi:hypothetical protein